MNTPDITARCPHPAPVSLVVLRVEWWLAVAVVARFEAVDATVLRVGATLVNAGAATGVAWTGAAATANVGDTGGTLVTGVLAEWAPSM